MATEDYRPDMKALAMANPARAFEAMATVMVQELNRLRQNPTTVFPALTKDQVVAALIQAWKDQA